MITLERYLGKTIDLIYVDQNEKLTRRRIRPLSVKDGKVLAYCFLRHSRRIFRLDNILSFLPVERGGKEQ